jgi:uncharacterized delta-60 repeat protein
VTPHRSTARLIPAALASAWRQGLLGLLGGLAVALALASPSIASAASPGSLDGSFGASGVASAHAGTAFLGEAGMSNGDVLAVGASGPGSNSDLVLARFTSSGGLDPSFGSGGLAHGPSVAGASVGRAVAVQPDGKIVVVGAATDPSGTYDHGLIVERYNANGSLDTSFGSGGVTELLSGEYGSGDAVAIQPDGKVLATGSADTLGSGGSSFPRVAVARLNANGSPDSGFGSGGTSVIDLGPYSYALGVALQPNGSIVIGGSQSPGLQATNALLARLTSSGALDKSFASGGVYAHQYSPGGAESVFNAVAVEGDGKIVAAGADSAGNTGGNAILARFSSGGAPDGSFGSGGVASSTSAANYSPAGTASLPGANGLVIAPNGDLIAAGTSVNGIQSTGTIWAFGPTGAPVASFGSGGKTTLPVGSQLAGVALSPNNGDFVAAGQNGSTGPTATGIVARLTGFGPGVRLQLSLKGVSSTYTVSSLAKHGLKAIATCSTGCKLKVALLASAGTARRLHITTTVRECRKVHGHKKCGKVRVYRALTIAPHSATLTKAGSRTFVLRLSKAQLKALSKQRKTSLTLQLTGTSTATHTTRVIRKGIIVKG